MVTRQPGGSESINIRDIVLWSKDICRQTRFLLHAADNAQHIYDTVKPALAENKIVIMDRGIGSAFAYQGWGDGFGYKKIESVYLWATNNFWPDITIFLDMDHDAVCDRRLLEEQVSSELDAIETRELEYHRTVYHGYKTLTESFDDWFKIDVTPDDPIEAIAQKIDTVVCDY